MKIIILSPWLIYRFSSIKLSKYGVNTHSRYRVLDTNDDHNVVSITEKNGRKYNVTPSLSSTSSHYILSKFLGSW